MYLLFSLLSLLSAFLLFQVQPVISKFILPWFGGSPGVWTTCMLFFQVVLFGGYAYAHGLSRLRPRAQWLVHSLLILVALAFLPIVPGDFWKPTGNEPPAGRILLLLLGTVGLPYFVLSSTSPLTQVWFTRAMPGRSPWRLYALSNLGSLTALLSYPFLIEPVWDVTTQTWIWSAGFVVFAMMSLWVVKRTRHLAEAPATAEQPSTAEPEAAPSWGRRLLWVILPAAASALLLATTNHVSQDVAVVPFMWVVPLSLYLLSFIICFEHERWYASWAWALPTMAVLFVTALGRKLALTAEPMPNYLFALGWSFAAVFLACMVCHGELARLKPKAGHLTEFYLLMSLGGALGGLLVSLVAPRVFVTYLEWPLGLIVCYVIAWLAWAAWVWRTGVKRLGITLAALFLAGLGLYWFAFGYVAPDADKGTWLSSLAEILAGIVKNFSDWVASSPETIRRSLEAMGNARALSVGAATGIVVLLLAYLIYRRPQRVVHALVILVSLIFGILGFHRLQRQTLAVDERLERVRNFYGAVNVDEDWDDGLENTYRTLTHGGIIHGMQNMGAAYREEPVTYYGRQTGIGKALENIRGRADARVAIVGMGAGTAACYARAGQQWRFYEINPEIPRLARKHFTYLADAERRDAKVTTILGDARLMLEREPDQGFDVLLLDAFSGDAIPVHLLTQEAFAIYRRHMKPEGVIVVHVTNSYLALAPVVEGLAADMGWKTARVITEEDGDHDSTDYLLLARTDDFLKTISVDQPENKEPESIPLWTDRRHNLFEILMLN